MAVAIAIIVILALAVGTVIVLVGNRQRSNTGLLSRETKSRDSGVGAAAEVPGSTSTELETTGRERADVGNGIRGSDSHVHRTRR